MDQAGLYLRSVSMGLAIAAPVGPMSLLCVRRTLLQGWKSGLATGLGIAVGDGIYAAVAALGLASLAAFLLAHQRAMHVAAGCVLAYLGIKALRASRYRVPGAVPEDQRRHTSWPGLLFGTAMLTLANPTTIVMFAAVLVTLAPTGLDSTMASLTVCGVFSGSLLWWCAMTLAIAAMRDALSVTALRWIDRVAGAALIVFGLVEIRRAT